MRKQRYRGRIVVVSVAVLLGLFGLIGDLFYIQIVQHEKHVQKAKDYQIWNVPVRPKRGNIYDRERRELATSSLLESLYADSRNLPPQKVDLALEIGRVLDCSPLSIHSQLKQPGHPPVARTLPPELADRLRASRAGEFLKTQAQKAPALRFVKESKRHYPKGHLACHVLGFTTFDDTGENKGLAGLELQYDAEIRGDFQKFEVLRDALGNALMPIGEEYYSAAFGRELILTLDASIQHTAEQALRTAMRKHQAKYGAIIVQKCRTGEILAMASWPDFETSEFSKATAASRLNRATCHNFGLGSVMKIFTAAALIETGRLTDLNEKIDCHDGEHVFRPRPEPVRDAPGHYLGVVPFREAFRWSSNVGMVEAAQRLDRVAYSRILEGFGFGQKTGIDLPGEEKGILRPVNEWSRVSMFALPYGAEMAVTPIQLVTAVSAIANGGLLMKPYLVKEIRTYEGRLVRRTDPTVRRRVIGTVTSRLVLELMEDVVGRKGPDGKWIAGTGKGGRIKGYRVAGKTGTHKRVTWNAEGDPLTSYTASFVAVLPLPDPELTVFCCIDQPRGAKYGGDVAAPVVKRVAEHSLRILGIPPNRRNPRPIDIDVALHQVRETARAPRSATPKGRMPDLTGLTMREVSKCLAGLNQGTAFKSVSFKGTGVAVSQHPGPNVRLADVSTCEVIFAPPSSDGAR